MDYKKKYENALPYIKDLIEHNVISIENAVKYFPELINSDEKVRKAIVELVLQSSEILGSNNQSRMLAWLEKQGKHETIWKPTKEQINALTHFVRSVGESGYASPYDNNTKLLYSLLTDLQALEKQDSSKVKPKFKIGQRIKQGNTIAEIKEISKDGYHCDIAFVPFTAEDNWELSLWDENDDKLLYECEKEIWKSAPTMLSLKHEKIEQWLESLKQRLQ